MSARALFVLPGFAGNGITRSILDLAAELAALGVRPEIFVLRPLDLREIPHGELPKVPVWSGDLPGGRRNVYRLPAAGARLMREARRADVVVAAWEVGGPFLAALAAGKAARRPFVTMVQSYAFAELEHYHSAPMAAATRWGYPRSDVVVCASDGLVEMLVGRGLPGDRLRVIRSGVDVERTVALAREPAPEWVPEEPFLLGVGRLADHKGFDLLIRAHADVLAAGVPHKLVILGQGERESELQRLVDSLGVRETTLFPGFVENPFPIMARSAALCGPSRFEGWGRMIAEALALGVPVIASNLAGPSAILAGGRYGDLVEPGEVEPLVSAIGRHLADQQRLRAKAALGQADPDSFSVKGRARGFAQLFAELAPVR